MTDLGLDFNFNPNESSSQAAAVYDSGESRKIVGSISKQEEGKKYFFRLFPFCKSAQQKLGMSRPEFHVKKYMFQSPIVEEDGTQKYMVTTSEKSIDPYADDVFQQHVLSRLKEMKDEGDDKGITLHNKLFSGPYSRKDVSVANPIMPNEFGIIEVWVGVIPIQADLQKEKDKTYSVPAGAPVLYNIKTSGRNKLFGKDGKKPVVGVVSTLDTPSQLMSPVNGVDFYAIKAGTEYSIFARRETTDLKGADEYYLDENRPNPYEVAESGIRSAEACLLYDLAIGKLSLKQYKAKISESVADVKEAAELAEGLS